MKVSLRLPVPPVLVISDRRQAAQPLAAVARAAFRGGCRWFSLREKDLPPAERLELLARLVAIGRDFAATVGVHDDVAAAAAASAGAVHLPAGGDPATARTALPAALIGVSAHSAEAAAAAFAAGADYVTLSPVFASASKLGYGPALGLARLAEIARRVPGPVVALGGIDAANAAQCLDAGAQGVAVMGEVMRAADPCAVVADLLRAIAQRR
jgi:thiamine-phosphate pyrophosphorylase